MPITDPITVAITRIVPVGRSREAEAWMKSGQDLLTGTPGYLGSGWVRPDAGSEQWHMLYRFADPATLQAWEQSSERAWWVASAVGIVDDDARIERRTGIEGWFDAPSGTVVSDEDVRSDAERRVPPRWKQMVSIFIVFYPLSLVLQLVISPFAGDLLLPLRVLIVTLCATPLMTYLLLPLVTRLLNPWLRR